MNVNDQNTEPVTDLVLALGYSNHCIQGRLNGGSGAGANAGSSTDMTFVATNPLSELVWSPQKGLSLKCADSSFANSKPSLAWGAGPSFVMLSPAQVKPIDEENLIKSRVTFDIKSEVGTGDNLTKSLRGNPSIMPLYGSSHEEKKGTEDQMNMEVESNTQPAELHLSSFPDEPKIDEAEDEPSNGYTIGRARGTCSADQTSRMEIVLASEGNPVNECEDHDTMAQNTAILSAQHLEAASIEKQSRNNMKETVFEGVPPLDKLESSAENDLQTMLNETAPGEDRKIVSSEPDHEIKNSFWQDEEALPSVSGEHSPTSRRIRKYRRKGKAKALCDGNVNGKMSNKDDESHESVESCNSAGLFSKGKKRWNFEQQLIVESKRGKKQIEDSPGSTSIMKQDSSFMNWISNMMKGFLKSNQDEPPDDHKSADQDLVTCNKSQDPTFRNAGFQSIFQSLYCPRTKVQETRMLDSYHQAEPEVATLVACRGENENLGKQFLASTEKFNDSTSGNGASLATQQKALPTSFAACQENSVDNKTLCNSANAKEKDGRSFVSSLGKRMTGSAENIDSKPPSEGKATHNSNYRSDLLGSLWITRFAPKTSGPSLNLDPCYKNSEAALDCSSGCMIAIPCSQDYVGVSKSVEILAAKQHSAEDANNAVQKELQNCAEDTEASIHLDRIKDSSEQKSLNKLNQIMPTPRLKISEAMASIFARRLDAFKHIMPSEGADNTASTTFTCFYCGRKGHHLKDCSEVTETELEDLLRNINTSKWTEDLHCFCIRCFQRNHWAAACPNASLKERHQSGSFCLVNDYSTSEMRISARDDEILKLMDGVESQFQGAGARIVCDRNGPRMEAILDLNCKPNETTPSDKLGSNANSVMKFIASSSGKNKSTANQTTPFCNYVNRQISGVPKGVFDAIKRLRLSRTDILKWMTSRMPLSHLDGFYLRLRLGKWEGLGGTGYHVACITETQQRETSLQAPQNSISVTVGGIKCLVESRYISNHDFLEDELMAWWDATQKCGGKIPSEESLSLKLKERKMLGM